MIPSVATFAAGAFAWTLAEYLLHDFMFHRGKGRTDASREHLRHHREEGYFAPMSKKAKFAALLVVPMAVVGWFAIGVPGVAFAAGFLGAYSAYEVHHRRIHLAAPLTRYGRWARRHHLAHHHRDATTNHGVTSPLWDIVFGSWRPQAPVKSPRTRAPAWLVAPDGSVRAEYAGDFVLVGPPRAGAGDDGGPAIVS